MELVLSIIALAVSVAAVSWTISRDVSTRGRLVIRVTIAKEMIEGEVSNEECLFVSVTNVGNRPVAINSLGCKIEKRRGFVLGPPVLPATLDSGASIQIAPPLTESLKQSLLSARALGVYDSASHFYAVRRRELRGLQKSLRQ